MTSHPNATEYLERLQQLIDTHGWAVQAVTTKPSFAYSVGLTERGLPELVICGMPLNIAQHLINDLATRLTQGALSLEQGRRYDDVLQRFDVVFRPLTTTQIQHHLGAVRALYSDRAVGAWQMLWPDPKGKLPGEAGVQEPYEAAQNLDLVDNEDRPV